MRRLQDEKTRSTLMIENKKPLVLKKHVAAIHSDNRLTLLQRKIANALLFNAYQDLMEKEEHTIHIPTLCNLIGYDSNDHKTIKKALVNLLSTVIQWNLVDGNKIDNEGVWNASSIIADASIDGAICTYSYSNKMKKLLHQPELYGRVNMLVQAKFRSSYGLALYENCIRYQNIQQTPWFELEQFRKLMGVEELKYKIFRDFKSRVIDKAVAEVNNYSPITITPQFRKHNRQVIAVQFLISQTKELENPAISSSEPTMTLSEMLKEKFGLSKTQIEDVMAAYEAHYIFEKMTIVESSPSFMNDKISNLAKYFLTALKEDYQPLKRGKKTLPSVQMDKFEKEKQKNVEQNRVGQYQRYQNKLLLKNFHALPQAKIDTLLNEFSKNLEGLYEVLYQREGLSNIMVQDQLCIFIKLRHSYLLESIPGYEEFSKETV